MAKVDRYSRIVIKRTSVPGLSATTAPTSDHTLLPAWSNSDIYKGEFFLNMADDKLWVRTDTGIQRIPFHGDVGIPVSMALPMLSSTFGSDPIPMESSSINVEKLSDIEDVDITDPKNDQVLTYKDNIWKNISNTTFSPVIKNPLEDNIMTYKDGRWVNGMFSVSDLYDVNIKPNITNKQSLIYDGKRWINRDLKEFAGMIYDKSTGYFYIDTETGKDRVLLEGKPISYIKQDTILGEENHTIIVDASERQVNVYLPPSVSFYGTIYNIKVKNDTNGVFVNVSPNLEPENFIFTDKEISSLEIRLIEGSYTFQSDGDKLWFSI